MNANVASKPAKSPEGEEPSKTGTPGKPGAPDKPDPKDDLKTLPIAEVEKRLASSPDGLTGAEAAKRLTKDGPNELPVKKDECAPEVPLLFLGSDTLDDRGRGDPVGRRQTLA